MNNKIYHFFDTVLKELKTSDKVTTLLGDFVSQTELGITGRNPRTGEEIKTKSKKFLYLFSSEYFIEKIFDIDKTSTKTAFSKNYEDTLARIRSRFGDYEIPTLSKKIEGDVELASEIIDKLKEFKKLEIKDSQGLLNGEIKISNKIYPAILFSASLAVSH